MSAREDPADRRSARLVHGRRRLRAGDERRDRDRAQPGHHLPRRPAAGEGRDRRDRHRRRARRRRPPRPHLRCRRPPGRERPRTPCRSSATSSRRCPSPRPPAWAVLADTRAGRRPGRALRRRADRRPGAVRRARGHRPAGRRQRVPRVQARVRHDARHRLRAHPRASGRHRRQQRRAVQRVCAQGRALHRAVRPAGCSAPVPPEHLGVHGRAATTRRAASPRTAPRWSPLSRARACRN